MRNFQKLKVQEQTNIPGHIEGMSCQNAYELPTAR